MRVLGFILCTQGRKNKNASTKPAINTFIYLLYGYVLLMKNRIVILVLIIMLVFSPTEAATGTAPDFTIPTTDGEFTLSEAEKPVLIDFMSFQCISCQELEVILKEVYPDYHDQIIFISIDVGGNSIEDLDDYRQENNISWHMGQGNNQLSIMDYRLQFVPTLILVDEYGNMTYRKSGITDEETLRTELDKLVEGEGETISLSDYGIYLLAITAGFFSFFSPCAFPLLPSYIAFYMRPDEKGGHKKGLTMGIKASAGIIVIFGILGIIGMLFGGTILRGLPYLEPIVGGIVIFLGITLLANIRIFDRMAVGWQNFKRRFLSHSKKDTNDSPFLYGMGYASASLGCAAPIFLALVATSWLVNGLVGTVVVLSLYLLTMAALMILFSLLTVYFRESVVNDFRDKVIWINRISGIVLVIAGVYLIYMYYI